jgi:hypothetical protein
MKINKLSCILHPLRVIPVEIGKEGGNVENEILFLSADLSRTVIGFMAVLTILKSRIQNVTSLSLHCHFTVTSLLSEEDLMEQN